MNIILFDTNRSNYYPLSFSRPISFFRVGILTIKEKWEQYFSSVSVKTDEYLSYKFPIILKDGTHIGGVGVSGASGGFDKNCAEKAVEIAKNIMVE